MSDRARFSIALGTLLLGASLAPGLAAQDVAPDAAEVTAAAAARVRLTEAMAASERAESTFVVLRDRGLTWEGEVVSSGLTVRFAPAALGEADRGRLAEGLERGRALLRDRFGAGGEALVSGATWYLHSERGMGGLVRRVALATGVDRYTLRSEMTLPLDPRLVEQFVVHAAGRSLAQQLPAVGRYAGEIHLMEDAERLELAAREMVLSRAGSGRRCAAGSAAACRAVLTVASPEQALVTWYDPADHRDLVRGATVMRTVVDDEFRAKEARCYAGDDASCSELAPLVRVRDPFTAVPRSSFTTHAITMGGAGALDRLRAAAAAGLDPIATLAATAAVSEEILITSWQVRTAAALRDAEPSELPLILTTAAWCGLLVFGATRRRP